jgi:plasmid stabilization system protein ParE
MARTVGAYRVTWTETATRDLEDIVTYIALDSREQAIKILKRIRGKAATLRQSPMRGRVVPELFDFGFRAWRELIHPPYRIIYRVEGKRVFIQSVLDGRRDVETILMERLLREI